MENPTFEDKELDRLYKEEGEQVVLDQLENDQRSLENLQITEKVLNAYYGWGLANEMPLGEALGFLDEELKNESPKLDKEDIERTRDFLIHLIPDKYSNTTELQELMLDFSKEKK
jgi:hypothetical protein